MGSDRDYSQWPLSIHRREFQFHDCPLGKQSQLTRSGRLRDWESDHLGHMANWFACMGSGQQPHGTVQDGFAHSVACMMAAEPYSSGKEQHGDAHGDDCRSGTWEPLGFCVS